MALTHHYNDYGSDGVHLEGVRVINFDSIDTSGGGGIVPLPTDQGGLTFSESWYVMKPSEVYPDLPRSGYNTGITSGDQVAFSAFEDPLEISAKHFNLRSVELTAAWDKSLDVHIVAYRGSNVVYDETIAISDRGPTRVEFDLKRITDITFTHGDGVPDKKSGGSGDHIVVDDLEVSNVKSLDSNSHIQSHLNGVFAFSASQSIDGHLAGLHMSADLAQHVLPVA